MCRSIKILRNIEPQASDTEVREAAKQFVRKISGYRHPPRQTPKCSRKLWMTSQLFPGASSAPW